MAARRKTVQAAVTITEPRLTSTLLERLARMAHHQNRTVDQVLHDIVHDAWVRHVCKQKVSW